MYPIKTLRVALAAALLTMAAGARADIVSLKEDPNNQPLAVTTSIYITGGAFNGAINAQIGQYRLDQQTPATSFGAYCVDPFQASSSNFQSYNRSAPLVSTNLPADQALRFAEVTKLYANAYAASLASATSAAGFQLALWEVWHDDKNLGSGNVRSAGYSVGTIVDEAQSLLNSLAGVSGYPVWSATSAPALTLYQSNTYQDYVSAAPEPGTYALMLAGLGLLGLARRRTS